MSGGRARERAGQAVEPGNVGEDEAGDETGQVVRGMTMRKIVFGARGVRVRVRQGGGVGWKRTCATLVAVARSHMTKTQVSGANSRLICVSARAATRQPWCHPAHARTTTSWPLASAVDSASRNCATVWTRVTRPPKSCMGRRMMAMCSRQFVMPQQQHAHSPIVSHVTTLLPTDCDDASGSSERTASSSEDSESSSRRLRWWEAAAVTFATARIFKSTKNY